MARYRMSSWRYSAFDGTQEPMGIDADDVLGGLTDDLLYHGDLAAALRRLFQDGFTTRDNNRIEGLRQMMERLRERREALAAQRNELAEHVAEALENVRNTERQALDQSVADAALTGDAEAEQRTRDAAAEHHAQLDLMPPQLSEQVRSLMHYDFVSAEAEQAFNELLDELRQALTQTQLDNAAGAMAASTPEDREHLRAGLDALNRMLEQRAAGEPLDPSFEQFMNEFGDLFPGNPADLDELLAQLAQRMAAASQMIAAMTPEQRAQLQALSDELMADMDLAWQMDRLGMNLRDALPQLAWDEPIGPPGDPLQMLGASDTVSELAELSNLEEMLRAAQDPTGLAEIDSETVERLLGPDAAKQLEALSEMTRRLEQAGLIGRKDGGLHLTPKGLRRLGSKALAELFAKLRKDRFGNHHMAEPGLGHDRDVDTKPYEYGDPFRLSIEKTLRNAITRLSTDAARAGEDGEIISFPVRLEPDDFEIDRTEMVSNASTVLAIDLSLSMPMRDNFLAAKKVAIALQSLIASQYPRDYLGLIGFSATAREIAPHELPEVSWDFAYGTNLQHALALSRKMLAHRGGTKQVIVITDGEPTAHVLEDGEIFFNYPPVPETIEATLQEVVRCTKERIVINTFVLDSTGGLRSFVERMTRMNKGRAFYTTPETLGDYLLVDFVENRSGAKRRRVRGA
jgi:uncharacterized protein with von Willebrand factor type A (vWA) domain